MRRFWSSVIAPLLTALQPATLVEIGALRGDHTRRLLDFCRGHAAVLHAVDPLPVFDVPAWQQTYGACFVFHRQLSLEALPLVGPMDAVLLDGDHNWHTVFHELTLIDRLARQRGQPLPLICLHDVGWPYGRRDMYYNPASIPPEYRQPYRRAGLDLNSSELLATGGLSAHLHHAIQEGGPRNGVLTAVEDYLAAAPPGSLHFSQVPGFHGLGVLASAERLASRPALAALMDKIDAAARAPAAAALRALEQQRQRLLIESLHLRQSAQRAAWPPRLINKLKRTRADRRITQLIAAGLT